MDKSEREKANAMQRWSRLATVRSFLERLGNWPLTAEEWAAAYDLFIEFQRAKEVA